MAIEAGDAVWTIRGDINELKGALAEGEQAVQKTTSNVARDMATIGKGMTVVGAAITGPLALGVKAAADFGSGLAGVASLGVQDMGKLEQSVRDVAVRYGQDLTGAIQGTYQAISAGVSEMDAPYVLEQAAIAATAGQTDLTTAIELGASMTNAFGLEMKSMEGVFDSAFVAVKAGVTTFEELSSSAGKTAPAFAAAGLSVDEMYGAVAALTKGGLGTAESFTSLNTVVASFTRQGEVAKLETLGLEGALKWLAETTGGNQTEMLKFLGSTEAMTAALSLTGGQAESFNEILGQMADKTGAAGEAFAIIAEQDPAFAWNVLKASMQDLAITVGQALMPALASIVQTLTPIIQSVAAWMKNNEGLTAGIVMVAGAIGALMLAVGPLLMMLPGLVALFGAFSGIAGASGLAGAIGVTGGAGLVGALGLLAPALALVAGALALGAVIVSAQATKEAFDQLRESEEALRAKSDEYTQSLVNKGVALDMVAASVMNHNELMAYTADAEKGHADTIARAWFEHYAGRTENEAEFGKMRNLMLNENISAQEAALAVSQGLTEEELRTLMLANEQGTASILEANGIRAQATQDSITMLTDAHVNAAAERNNIWMNETHQLVAYQEQAAQQMKTTWLQAISQMAASVAQFVMGLPLDLLAMFGVGGGGKIMGRAEGGQLQEGMNIVGERGPEAIIKRGSETRVISASNTQAGGGDVTVNLNNVNIASDMDVERVARRLGELFKQRMTAIGMSPTGARA